MEKEPLLSAVDSDVDVQTAELVEAGAETYEYQPAVPDWGKVQRGEQLGSVAEYGDVDLARAFRFASVANVAFDIATDPNATAAEKETAEADMRDALELSDRRGIMSQNSSPFARNTPEWRNMRKNSARSIGFAGLRSEDPIREMYLSAEKKAQLERDPAELRAERERREDARGSDIGYPRFAF